MRRLLLLAASGTMLAACGGDSPPTSSSDYGGTMVIATGADADVLLPPVLTTLQGNEIADIIFERLAEPGAKLNVIGDVGFVPELASQWTWSADSLSISFAIQPGAHFHDGHPVTAKDVKFTFDLYTDPASNTAEAPLLANIDSVTAHDSLTVVFWFSRRYPQQFFDATYHMRILPEHLLRDANRSDLENLPFARAPIGSGRFRFSRWEPGVLIEIVADTTHVRGRPYLDRIVWTITPNLDAAVTRVLAGDADFVELITPNYVPQVKSNPDVALVPYPALDLAYLQFNLRDPRTPNAPHPIFGDRRVRRAMAMSVDRERIVRSVLDSLGVVPAGLFARALATSDSTLPQLPYDPARARALLDSAGWRDPDGNGTREKNGRALRFSLIVPSSSTSRNRSAVLIQEMFSQIGARMDLQQMEFNAWRELTQSRNFDATFNAVHFDPSPSTIRQSWTSESAHEAGSSNYSSYSNPEFDAVVDSAVNEMDQARSTELYHRAYQILNEDVPAIFVYEPVNLALRRTRLIPAPMRADAWWTDIADWKIAPDMRLPRDEMSGVAERN